MKNLKAVLITFLALSFLVLYILGCATTNYTKYDNITTEIMKVDNLVVSVVSQGGIFWGINVLNNSDKMVKLLWDESVYVSSMGKSSRLIRGATKVIHSAQIQPPSPIPPKAQLIELFTSEDFLNFLKNNPAYENVEYLPVGNPSNPGRLYITFEIDGIKEMWEGTVNFVEVKE